ncbi:MAG: hypothetical protein F6K39_44875 [Okeania sp. SIO3B3]|nr:hypothetical protein [Okeania sp. SIO3B3]
MQLLKNATKIMLAIPTKQGNVAALSFAVAADGTLAEIDENLDSQTTLRSNSRDLLLPLNTLDEIKGIGDSTPSVEYLHFGERKALMLKAAMLKGRKG